ncbi:MAG: hypothetical protein ABR569_06135 [Gaiellaceae bacterium]
MRAVRAIAALVCAAALSVAPGAAQARAGAGRACRADVHLGVLPVWARAGFSDPQPRLPHVLGRSGKIAALVFGYPLLSPPSPTRNNKILWVARASVRPLSALRISAQRMIGRRRLGRPITRAVQGGPGPSIVNLPTPGCWRLRLRWSGRSDSLDLRYARRS